MNFSTLLEKLSCQELPITFPGHWIGNRWTNYPKAKPTNPSINPNTGETLLVCNSDKQVLLDALTHAEAAEEKLDSLDQKARIEIVARMRQALTDYRKSFIEAMRLQGGKPKWEAEADFDAAIRYLDNFQKQAKHLPDAILGPARLDFAKSTYKTVPVGTVVAYLPFSTPMVSFAKYFTSAVITGCPLIVCPSLHTSISAMIFGHIAETLDLIPGSFAIAFGTFENFQSVISDRRIQAIIFTGSREHCELIRRESRSVPGRQLVLQSGGKNSVLVHSSADLNLAINCVMQGAFKSTGQLCSSTSRVFVHKSLSNQFCESLLAAVKNLPVDRTDNFSGTDKTAVLMGPLYSQKAVDKFLRYQTMAHREAAKDLLWGKSVETKDEGCLVTPGLHLMKTFDNNSAYQSNVLFCPDIAIYEYDVLDQAIEMINATDAPFCVSFIGDEEMLKSRIVNFVAPNILCNTPTVAVEHQPSVAGKLQSGHHRFNGLGLALLLSYPQLNQSRSEHEDILKAWPSFLD